MTNVYTLHCRNYISTRAKECLTKYYELPAPPNNIDTTALIKDTLKSRRTASSGVYTCFEATKDHVYTKAAYPRGASATDIKYLEIVLRIHLDGGGIDENKVRQYMERL